MYLKSKDRQVGFGRVESHGLGRCVDNMKHNTAKKDTVHLRLCGGMNLDVDEYGRPKSRPLRKGRRASPTRRTSYQAEEDPRRPSVNSAWLRSLYVKFFLLCVACLAMGATFGYFLGNLTVKPVIPKQNSLRSNKVGEIGDAARIMELEKVIAEQRERLESLRVSQVDVQSDNANDSASFCKTRPLRGQSSEAV
jgi:hypothetical protein